jgi:serine/threonine protein kinase
MNTDDWLGKRLAERYRIEETIGQGGMSVVYKAYDTHLRRAVAIKMIHPHLSSEPGFVNRFKDEATAIARLRHSNIVQVYDLNNEDNTYYIVMELIPGETLEHEMKRLNDAGRQMPLTDIINYMVDICQAAEYAHARGLIHRDIKPLNIMLTIYKRAILMDFGISKIIGGHRYTATGAVVGTALYMSPEQISGLQLDRRSDIYSLGVTLFEMVCGHPPFDAESPMPIMMMHIHDPVPDIHKINPDIPAELVGIINKALAKKPDDRYNTAGDMASALTPILEQPVELSQVEAPASLVETLAVESPPSIEEPEPEAEQSLAETVAEDALVTEVDLADAQEILEEPKLPSTTMDSVEEPARLRRFRDIKPLYLFTVGAVILAGIITAIIGGQDILEIIKGSGGDDVPVAIASPTKGEEQVIAPSTPSPNEIPWSPTLFDDFEDLNYESSLNSTKWEFVCQDECQIMQNNGRLVLEDTSRAESGDTGTFLFVNTEDVLGKNLVLFEADLKVDELATDTSGALVLNHGLGWIQCGIGSYDDNNYVELSIFDSEDKLEYRRSINNIDPYSWNTIRLEIDPNSMSFSCYFNGLLIDSNIPELGVYLKNYEFSRYLQFHYDLGKSSKLYVDNIRLSSPTEIDDEATAISSDLITWDPEESSECQILREDGILVVETLSVTTEKGYGDCFLNLPENPVLGHRLKLFEMDVKIEDFSGDGQVWVGMVTNHGKGWIECGIYVRSELTNAAIISHGPNAEQEFVFLYDDVDLNRWNTLQMGIDPGTMTFSCYINDHLVGSGIPERIGLSLKPFHRYIQVSFDRGTQSRIYIDNIKSSP